MTRWMRNSASCSACTLLCACTLILALTSCRIHRIGREPRSANEIRLYNLDQQRRERNKLSQGDIEVNPFLIQFPNNQVYDLDATMLPTFFEDLCEGVIREFVTPVTLKLRFLSNANAPVKTPLGYLPLFDTTLVLDPATLPPGDYELIKMQDGSRHWLELKPWPPNDPRRKWFLIVQREFTYDAVSQHLQTRLPVFGNSLEELWPAKQRKKRLRYVGVWTRGSWKDVKN